MAIQFQYHQHHTSNICIFMFMKTLTWQIQVPGLTHCPLAPQPAGQIGLRQRLVGGFTWAESSLQILRLHPIIIISLLILWFWELAHLPAWTTLTASSTPANIGSACSRYWTFQMNISVYVRNHFETFASSIATTFQVYRTLISAQISARCPVTALGDTKNWQSGESQQVQSRFSEICFSIYIR